MKTEPPNGTDDSASGGSSRGADAGPDARSDAGPDAGAGPGPGTEPAAGARPRRSRTALVVGTGLAAVLLLLCCGVLGGCVAFGYGVFAGPRQALDEFLTAAEDGDYAVAQEHLCTNLRDRVGQDTVRRWLDRDGPLVAHEVTGGWVRMPGDRNIAEVSVELTFDGGDVRTDNVPLVREGEQWKVCGEVG